jgi:hypothetical protein
VLGIPSEVQSLRLAVMGHHRMHTAHEAEVPSFFVMRMDVNRRRGKVNIISVPGSVLVLKILQINLYR